MLEIFMKTNGITIVSAVYLGLIIILFLLKQNNKKITTKIFKYVLFITLGAMIVYTIWAILALFKSEYTMLAGRLAMCSIVVWDLSQCLYISLLFRDNEKNKEFLEKNKMKLIILGIVLFIINLIISLTLPFESYQDHPNGSYFTGGLLTTYMQAIGALTIIYSIVIMIKERKKHDKLTKILFSFVIVICAIQVGLAMLGFIKINDNAFLDAMIMIFLYLSMESQDAFILESYNESVKKAEESNKLKAEFIMNMSHQLRTPMNTILGFSESILTTEDLTLEGVKEDSENIKIASKRLLDLINSILDISKIESKKEVLNNEDYNLDSIIYDVSSHINSKINKDNIVFTINANSNCPNDLYGDGYKLCKILNIILYNAIKNTEYGEVSLNVSSSVVDAENHEFTFHIKNTGHAMKVESFERNFDDLMRLNSEGNNDIDADTLKIIVAKGLLNILGGTIDFINQTGQGTQYIIKVKQKVTTQNELGNIREKIQTKHDVSHEIISLIGKKALIIDDKKINSIILERLLEQYNITVKSISNPRDGVEKAVNLGYDIIFVDHEMEEMTGEEVVKKLEASGNKIPPVVGLLTGITEVKDIKNYTVTLNCPIEFRELNAIILKLFKN